MIEFQRAKVFELKGRGKKGAMVWKIQVVGQVTETIARALGDDVRNTLYNSKGVIRPSFGKMELNHVFSDSRFHLSVAGVKNAELLLDGVTAHKFRVAMRGDGDKKPKTLLCGFEIEYINKPTGTSSIDLWNFANSFSGAEGALKLKYPEQQPMFTEGKKEKEPEIVPGGHKFAVGAVLAEIRVVESKGGWTATRKATIGDAKLPQKADGVESASEAEALALVAYQVRTFAEKRIGGMRGKSKLKAAAEELVKWAAGFTTGAKDLATAGAKDAAKTVPITRHTS